MLCAQLSDWKEFRRFQGKIRRHYLQQKAFSYFEDQVRERRRKHKVEGDVRLRPEPGKQSRLESWIEFQDYHLQRHEGIKKDIDNLKTKLDDARKESEYADAASLKRATRDAKIYQERLESAERRLGQHKILLRWIEWERILMDAGPPTSVERDHDDQDGAPKAVRKPSAPDHRNRRSKAHSVLSPTQAGVLKPEPRKRNMQRQKRKVHEAKPAITDLGAPQSSASRIPNGRENKPRHTKQETPLRPFRPQRVSKVKRHADANAKSLSATRLHGVEQERSLDRARPKHPQHPQRPQSAPVVVKTRSGRESRRPKRWVPR